MNTSVRNDILARKIRVLQSIAIFRNVNQRKLMPIAANSKFRTYKFGEALVERDEVPDGLFIIIKG